MVVTGVGETNTARTYDVAVSGEKGLLPLGRTNPQRAISAEEGELIRVRVSGITRREDGGTVKWSLLAPTPVKQGAAPAAPSKLADVQRLWEGMK